MLACMATTKITVTVPEELAEYIRGEVAAGRSDSVSAFITRAADTLRNFDPLDLLIADLVAETGEPGEAAEARLDAAEDAARRSAQQRSGEHAP